MEVQELTFQRAVVHLAHDVPRLQAGADLNDALLDFFVKLGQALIPEGAGNQPAPVAYLGSHFYDVLRKGGVKDGREGHQNVANWARRRLGKGGLFADGVGALAVPVNEVLAVNYDGKESTEEKHWWLALILNPRAAVRQAEAGGGEDVSLLCLDSFMRRQTHFSPPIRACKRGGTLEGYFCEVSELSRTGFCVNVHFRAQGDGTAGAIDQPRKSRLKAGGREFPNLEMNLTTRERGGDGKPGVLEGEIGFRLDRRGAAKTGGEYMLEFGGAGEDYQPALRLRMGQKPTNFQAEVSRFLGGYLAREWEVASGAAQTVIDVAHEDCDQSKLDAAMCLPGVPQQETSHDCGFFILEQILRALQLQSRQLRELATASSVEIAMLPWPSQRQVLRRKALLNSVVSALATAARKAGTGDVERLIKIDGSLSEKIRGALRDGGSSFTHGFERWEMGDWDLSASPSRSPDRPKRTGSGSRSQSHKTSRSDSSRSYSSGRRKDKKKKKKKHKRKDTSDSSRESSSRSRKRRKSRSRSRGKHSSTRSEVPKPTFTRQHLELLPVGALRAHCETYKCLPPNALERIDLIKALLVVSAVPPPPPAAADNAVEAAVAKHAAAEAVKSMPFGVPAPPPPAKRFTLTDLEAMPSRDLRSLCVQMKVLPSGSVERGDLIQALLPLSAAENRGVKPAQLD